MALIISQSLASSDPLDQSATKAIGVSLPLVMGSTGYFRQTFTTEVAIRTDLSNLLLTRIGERPMNPEFGSGLHNVLFQQQGSDIDSSIDTIVRSAVSRWMPFVNIDSVDVNRETGEPDIYTMRIVVTYSVPNVVGKSYLALLVES